MRLLLASAAALFALPAMGAVFGTDSGCYWHRNGDLPADWQDVPLIVTEKALTFTEVDCTLAATPKLDGSPLQAQCVEAGSEDEVFSVSAIMRENADGTVAYADHAYELTLSRCE
jgi:hypothetical protein